MIQKPTIRRGIAVVGTVLALVAVAACGSDSEDSDDTTAATAAATTAASSGATTESTASAGAATGSPIKIGYAAATVSDEANKATVEVVESWESWVNAEGGIAGHPVEVIVRDSKNDAATTQAAVKDLVETEKVAAIVLFEPYAEGAIGDYITEHKVPIIGATGYNVEVWSANPYFFSMTTTQPTASLQGTQLAAELDAKVFGPVVCAEVAACAQIKDLFDPALQALAIKSAGLVTVEFAAPSFTAECLALLEEDVDFIAFNIAAAPAARMAQDCTQQGFDGTYYLSHTAFDQVVLDQEPLHGTKWTGSWFGFPWYADAPGAQQYRDVVTEYSPDTDLRFGSSTSVWASLELFRKALAETTGEVTAATVLDAYYALSDETLDGLLPQPMNFEPGQPASKVTCFWPFQWTNGDEQPTAFHIGESGNGATGDLQSSCEVA